MFSLRHRSYCFLGSGKDPVLSMRNLNTRGLRISKLLQIWLVLCPLSLKLSVPYLEFLLLILSTASVLLSCWTWELFSRDL